MCAVAAGVNRIAGAVRGFAPGFLLALCACAATRPVAHGPFLLRPGMSSINVAARTREDAQLTLDLRSTTGKPVVSIEECLSSRRHLFSLEGLEPGTRYAYRLSGVTRRGDSVREEGTLGTAPLDASASIRVVVIGDSGVLGFFRRKVQWRVAAEAARFRPDLFIHLGDIVYSHGGDPVEEFAEGFFDPFRGILRDAPVCPTPGDHDQAIAEGAVYNESFFVPEGPEGRWYSFDRGPAHFVSLDTSTLRGFTAAQMEWLERDLQASVLPWKVIFTHHPPIGAHGDGQLDDPLQLAPVLEVARRRGVRLILAGHEHAYLRYKPLGDGPFAPILVVSGGGGATLSSTVGIDPRLERFWVRHHHLRLAISPDRLECAAVGLEEEVLDRFTLER